MKARTLSVLLAAALALTACGNGGSSSDPKKTETSGSAAASTQTGEKKPEDYTGNLVVYSPHDADPLAAGVALFEKTYPNIKVSTVAAGTGELAQRIVAESANPQGDVLWGGGADTVAAYTEYLEPYVTANDGVIDAKFKDKDNYWTGESPLPMVFIYNKKMIDEKDVPKTWEDLTNSALKGKIAYASPAKSGSAYTQLCTMLFSQPSMEEGWSLVEKFIANLDGKIQDSSGNAHKLVASGEYALGITIEKSAVLYKDNPDIGFVYPQKDSAVPDGVALIKGAPNSENAKLFIDFVTGKECQTEQNQEFARRPVRSDITPVGLAPLTDIDMGDYDFHFAATERDSIIEKWNDLTVK